MCEEKFGVQLVNKQNLDLMSSRFSSRDVNEMQLRNRKGKALKMKCKLKQTLIFYYWPADERESRENTVYATPQVSVKVFFYIPKFARQTKEFQILSNLKIVIRFEENKEMSQPHFYWLSLCTHHYTFSW